MAMIIIIINIITQDLMYRIARKAAHPLGRISHLISRQGESVIVQHTPREASMEERPPRHLSKATRFVLGAPSALALALEKIPRGVPWCVLYAMFCDMYH